MKIMENDNIKNIPFKFQVPCIALPKNSMRAIITRVVTEEQVKAEHLGFCIDPAYFKEFDQSAFEFVQALREISMDIELCEFGDTCANFAAVRNYHFNSIRFANTMIKKAHESKKYMSILKMMIGVGRELDINSIIVINEDERERFNDALGYCYTYCTGANVELAECEELLRSDEVINRYTCPNFKHDFIDGVISGL